MANDAFEQFTKQLKRIQDTVDDKWQEFKANREKIEEKVARCHNLVDSGTKISLDIGGTTFSTTAETLLKEKESFFWAMLHSGRWDPEEATGQYFIDRSPQLFGVILDYLRYGKVGRMKDLTASERVMLKEELDFYCISSFPPFSTGITWNTNSVNAAGTAVKFVDENHQVSVGMPCPTIRTIDSEPFEKYFCGETLQITLHVKTPTLDKLGSPAFYFGEFGIGLVTGNITYDGNTWVSIGFPRLDCTTRVYLFELQHGSTNLTITWPNRVEKSVQLPKLVKFAHISCKSATDAQFHISSI
eukprot:TRINITY_DN67356_c5_g1_i1.p1 TRINITY_DN67356_c5_g1~~TRINITY_DN67356_c5_g1_i1.p1  ORF type:complete len:325 (-),score=24.77 TRINITY_DN67356_c5_g1_i1:58-960(-)